MLLDGATVAHIRGFPRFAFGMSHDQTTWNLDESFRSELGAHHSFLDQVLAKLAEEGWHEKHIFGIRLSLEEALVNAVRHGNALDKSKQVRATCRLDAESIWVEVVDEGSGFNPNDVPDPTCDENLEKPCGRGILLMRNYMTRVEYNAQGNRVTMEKRRSDPTDDG